MMDNRNEINCGTSSLVKTEELLQIAALLMKAGYTVRKIQRRARSKNVQENIIQYWKEEGEKQ